MGVRDAEAVREGRQTGSCSATRNLFRRCVTETSIGRQRGQLLAERNSVAIGKPTGVEAPEDPGESGDSGLPDCKVRN